MITDIKKQVENLGKVHALLLKNKGNGVLVGREIVEKCELANGAEVRTIVHTLRYNGHPICSNRNGYWIATTDEEIMETVAHLKSRAYSMMSAALRMQMNLLDQQEFDDFCEDTYID